MTDREHKINEGAGETMPKNKACKIRYINTDPKLSNKNKSGINYDGWYDDDDGEKG